jgi:small subunit ribosomal protein S10
MAGEKMRIYLKAFDHRILDKATKLIVETVKKTGSVMRGPVPLPTEINKYCVLRSPHVDKKSREEFEVRTHKRLIDILNTTPETINSLMNMEIPSGVNIEIKL